MAKQKDCEIERVQSKKRDTPVKANAENKAKTRYAEMSGCSNRAKLQEIIIDVLLTNHNLSFSLHQLPRLNTLGFEFLERSRRAIELLPRPKTYSIRQYDVANETMFCFLTKLTVSVHLKKK